MGFCFAHAGTTPYCIVLHWTGLCWTGLDWTILYRTVQYDRTKNLPTIFLSFFFPSSSPQAPILAILYHTQVPLFYPLFLFTVFYSFLPLLRLHFTATSRSASQQTGYASYVDRQTASKQATLPPLLTNYRLPSLSSHPRHLSNSLSYILSF